MNLKEIRDFVRGIADDTATPPMWPDVELNGYINEAELQACRRAHLLTEFESAEICKLTAKAGVLFSTLDPRIIVVRSARLDGSSIPLEKCHNEDLDDAFPNFRTQTGTIRAYNLGLQSGRIAWLNMPITDQVVRLSVVREPLKPMVDDDDQSELAARHQYGATEWVLHRMYSKKNTETFDGAKAKDHADRFTAEFGPPLSAVEEKWQAENYGYTDDGSR